jgi:hypothetical protein
MREMTLLTNFTTNSILHCIDVEAEGINLMRKLDRDQMQMTPRNCRTFRRVPKELFIAMLCGVNSAPLTVNDKAVTNCAALFSWCSLYTC